jgi:lipoprotein-anchoring transpeptidase ErfK/SrfK
MRKHSSLLLILLIAVAFAASIGKNKLASYLLTRELTSDEKVNEILAQKNNPLESPKEAIFNNQKIDLALVPPAEPTEIAEGESKVLGDTSGRWIEVNLSQQRLNAWEGGNLKYSSLVSTGKWAPTPTGNFSIYVKYRSTLMAGGSRALGTYYYLPNVPCTMYFYKGYGLHGTYWHNNFGHPMSHGCVNLPTPMACTLFDWASIGTPVNIHY